MDLKLTSRDKQLIGTAFLFPVLAAILGHSVTNIEQIFMLDSASQAFASLVFIISSVLVYRVYHLYGGDVGRALVVMGIGLIFASSWTLYASWHIIGAMTEPLILGPAWFGLKSEWWGTFFHTLVPAGYAIVSYGFYLFWDIGGE